MVGVEDRVEEVEGGVVGLVSWTPLLNVDGNS